MNLYFVSFEEIFSPSALLQFEIFSSELYMERHVTTATMLSTLKRFAKEYQKLTPVYLTRCFGLVHKMNLLEQEG